MLTRLNEECSGEKNAKNRTDIQKRECLIYMCKDLVYNETCWQKWTKCQTCKWYLKMEGLITMHIRNLSVMEYVRKNELTKKVSIRAYSKKIWKNITE